MRAMAELSGDDGPVATAAIAKGWAGAGLPVPGARRADQEGPDLLRRARHDRVHRAPFRPVSAQRPLRIPANPYRRVTNTPTLECDSDHVRGGHHGDHCESRRHRGTGPSTRRGIPRNHLGQAVVRERAVPGPVPARSHPPLPAAVGPGRGPHGGIPDAAARLLRNHRRRPDRGRGEDSRGIRAGACRARLLRAQDPAGLWRTGPFAGRIQPRADGGRLRASRAWGCCSRRISRSVCPNR